MRGTGDPGPEAGAGGRISPASWFNLALWSGLSAFACYLAAAFVPLPGPVSLLLAFAFGPLFMLASLGLYHIIGLWKDSVILRVALLFNTVAAALVTLMLVVQQTVFAFHQRFLAADPGSSAGERLLWAFKEVNSVQLGIDIAWDIFGALGTACFAVALWGHPLFGRAFAIGGVLASTVLLAFNLAYFPVPPGEAGSIDFGPLVALWYIALTGWLGIKRSSWRRLWEPRPVSRS